MKTFKVYQVSDKLDSSNSNEAQTQIVELLETFPDIVLDFSRCSFVSSAGLRVILHAYKTAKKHNGSVELAGVSDEIINVMTMTGLVRFFKFHRTVAECLNVQAGQE